MLTLYIGGPEHFSVQEIWLLRFKVSNFKSSKMKFHPVLRKSFAVLPGMAWRKGK